MGAIVKYLITVEIPSDPGVDTALVIPQIMEVLKLLPRDFNANVEEVSVENPPEELPPSEEVPV